MEEYEYGNLPLTPAIIEELTVKLFNGKMVKRDEIIRTVLEYHKTNGGLDPEAKDFSRSVKTALASMSKKGWSTNKSYGFWEIHREDSPIIVNVNEEEKEEDIIKDDTPSPNSIYGSGDSSVYLYYYEAYKKLSLLQNVQTWPCKIGKTDRNPVTRILSQISTALPELPTIEYIIETDDASLLETTLHSILKLKGKQIEESPGTEWFDTNPDEIIELIKSIDENLLKSANSPISINTESININQNFDEED